MWLIVAHDAGAQQQQHRHQRDVREARHDDRQAGDPAAPAARLSQSTSSPISPPSHTEPVIRCSQSRITESPRGEVCAACPAAPGMSSTAAAREQRAGERDDLGDRAVLAFGPVEPQRDPRRRRQNSAKQSVMST